MPSRALVALVVAVVLALAVVVTIRLADDVDAAPKKPEGTLTTRAALPTARPGTIGEPRDPLSLAEIGYAKHLAETDPSMPDGVRDVLGQPQAELLAVDLATMDDGTRRRLVDVVLYDYARDQVVVQTVDLDAGEVTGTDRLRSQPPPSPGEIEHALDLVLESIVGEHLRADYLLATGEELDPGTLMPSGGVVECAGRHRCIELQIRVPGGDYLAASGLVVDLSDGAVLPVETPDHDHEEH
ncbi:hypothetical protein [Mumia sp. DW29H23]|uniref:hypothetical protein n=1 Tax=Mumia sp. DW29H23 TaxID=3421241 RepID=UPI003D697115